MKTLQKKNPKFKTAINELKFVSQNKKSREYYEAWLKTERDYAARTDFQLQKMKEETQRIKEEAQKIKEEAETMKEKAVSKRNKEIALVMLSKNLKLDFISEVTGLSLQKLKSLGKKKTSK